MAADIGVDQLSGVVALRTGTKAMTNRANAFRAEHAIRDGDLVKLKLEVGRNARTTR